MSAVPLRVCHINGHVVVSALHHLGFVALGRLGELAATEGRRSSIGTGVGRCGTVAAYAIPLPLASEGGICCGSCWIQRWVPGQSHHNIPVSYVQ